MTYGDSVYRKCDLYSGKLYTKTHGDVIYDMNIPADVTMMKGRPYLCDSGHISEKNYRSKFFPTDFEEIFPGLRFEDEIGERLNQAFLDDVVVAATYGSVKNGLGAGAFCLSTRAGTILFEYNFPVPGEFDDIHSTRTEMFAILAVLIFLKKIHAKYKYATKLPSTIFTDSQNAIRAAFQQIFVTISNVFENDCDVLSELRWHIQLSRFLITLQHVKAHQL